MISLNFLRDLAGRLNWTQIIIISVVIGMWLHSQQQHAEDLRRQTEFFGAVMDSTRHYIAHGQRVAETSQIRTSDPKVFLTMKSDDPRLQALQAEVKQYRRELAAHGGSVATFISSTKIDTTLIAGRATDGRWFDIQSDGQRARVAIRNDYSVAQVEEGGKAVIKIKNRNPYATEDSIKVFATLPKEQKRWGIGPYGGYDAARGISAGIAVSFHLIQW